MAVASVFIVEQDDEVRYNITIQRITEPYKQDENEKDRSISRYGWFNIISGGEYEGAVSFCHGGGKKI